MYTYLNFNDLKEDAQDELLSIARERLDHEEVREEARKMNIDFKKLLNEKAQRELYSLNIVFNI